MLADERGLVEWYAETVSHHQCSVVISSRCVAPTASPSDFLCAWELADKYDALPIYSDDGSLPRSTVMPEARGEGRLVWLLCVHAWCGELLWTQALVGRCSRSRRRASRLDYHPVVSSLLTWWLHCSFCWRNASLVYILDRYIHLLLLYSAFMSKSKQQQQQSVSGRVRPSLCSCSSFIPMPATSKRSTQRVRGASRRLWQRSIRTCVTPGSPRTSATCWARPA